MEIQILIGIILGLLIVIIKGLRPKKWTEVKRKRPKENVVVIGLHMPYETYHACYLQTGRFYSHETDKPITITHWHKSLKPPKQKFDEKGNHSRD